MNGTSGIGLDWSGLIGLLIIAGIFGYVNGQFVILSCCNLNRRGTASEVTGGKK